MNDSNNTHKLVQKAYADIARKQSSCCRGPSTAAAGQAGSCCGEAKP